MTDRLDPQVIDELSIRPARPGDADVVAELAQAAYRRYLLRMAGQPGPMMADYVAIVSRGDTWLAERPGEVVGYIVLQSGPDHLLLENVAVRPDAQEIGVGSRLLNFAEEQARERGLSEIRLYTHEVMTENQAYYQRRGYRETGRRTEHGHRRVFFTKEL